MNWWAIYMYLAGVTVIASAAEELRGEALWVRYVVAATYPLLVLVSVANLVAKILLIPFGRKF